MAKSFLCLILLHLFDQLKQLDNFKGFHTENATAFFAIHIWIAAPIDKLLSNIKHFFFTLLRSTHLLVLRYLHERLSPSSGFLKGTKHSCTAQHCPPPPHLRYHLTASCDSHFMHVTLTVVTLSQRLLLRERH